jgi:hypothetical protein
MIFDERVLGAVLRDDRDASPHPHVSRVVDYDLSGFEFYFFLLRFYLRDFAAHSDGVSPVDVGVVFYSCYSGLLLFCIIIIIVLFILRFFLFYSFSLSYARLVVRTWRD